MWKDASRNRSKWGCKRSLLHLGCPNAKILILPAVPVLGQTPPLVAGDDDCSNTIVWIAYWKSVAHLTAWAHGEVHRAGWDWFNAAKLKHIGLQHETYMVPKGQWESVQHNMRPFGFGELSQIGSGEALHGVKLTIG